MLKAQFVSKENLGKLGFFELIKVFGALDISQEDTLGESYAELYLALFGCIIEKLFDKLEGCLWFEQSLGDFELVFFYHFEVNDVVHKTD